MKTLLRLSFCSLAILIASNKVDAQALTPAPSTNQTIEQSFGLGKVSVNYNRPNVKNRKIFGGLIPYDKVWRTGANNATSITFSEEVSIAGNKIPAGKYSLFTIPGVKEWTVIINKDASQWGSYTYKQEQDLARVKVKPYAITPKVETFTIQFANITNGTLDLNLSWENTGISIPFKVDFDAQSMANIDAAMKTDKKPYSAAAAYYLEHNKDLNKALEWANEAVKANPKAPWFKALQARILIKMGNKKAANVAATEGLKIAQEIKNDEYIKISQELINLSK